MLTNNCKEYFSNAKISEQEIRSSIEKSIASLGKDRAEMFLSLAYSTLKESVESLLISIEANDIESCAQYAHKLRGSSGLYASEALVDTLLYFIEQPSQSTSNLAKCEILVCEFELVLSILKERRL